MPGCLKLLTLRTVRVRPFTIDETSQLQQISDDPLFLGDGSLAGNGSAASRNNSRVGSRAGIRKVINVVDDRMLIFDPPETNPMVRMQRAAFPSNTTRIREHRFVFDRLFDDTASQEDVYSNSTRPLLDSVLDGYNATVFAYGATGCGKTHTISGNPQAPGIIFLTMKELFERITEIRDTKLVDVSLSYLEIYNETIRDLLEPSSKQLILRENVDSRISVSNLSSHKPESVEEVMDMILQGNQNRTVSPTEANATSSRSHAVLQINLVQKGRTASVSQTHTFATLSIIDLAGSERASATKNRGDRLLEGANINKSLLALGNCINALCDPRRRNHVPYRDSKLTRLLKFSLGGNCKTVMIVCVSPSSKHYDETLNTLKYADRAKKIKTKVIRNEHNLDRHVGSYLKMITEQKAEIEELRRRETKAVGTAIAIAEKARNRCLQVLDDAMESLRMTYSKTAKVQEQTCKILKQLRNIINQINQVECILRSFEMVVASHKSPLTEAIPAFIKLSECMKNALQKLVKEKEAHERHCASVTREKQMRDSALATLVRRLDDTPGWTDADRVSFRAQAEALRLKSEVEMLEQVAGEPIPTKIIENLSGLVFTIVAKIGCLKTADGESLNSELEQAIDEIINNCHARFDQILGDYSAVSNAELNTNNCGSSGNSRNNNMGLSSFLAKAIKRPASVTSLQRDVLQVPPLTSRSSGRRLSGGLNTSTSIAVSAGRRMVSTSGISGLRSLRRQVPGSAKKQVVVKSPMRNHRKAVKRVRWEDDGELCLDPPTPSRAPRSGQGEIKKSGLAMPAIRADSGSGSSEDDDSLPAPPEFSTLENFSVNGDATTTTTSGPTIRVLSPTSTTKRNSRQTPPPQAQSQSQSYNNPSIDSSAAMATGPGDVSVPWIPQGSAPSSPSKSNPGSNTNNLKFGVKGELRRKSGSAGGGGGSMSRSLATSSTSVVPGISGERLSPPGRSSPPIGTVLSTPTASSTSSSTPEPTSIPTSTPTPILTKVTLQQQRTPKAGKENARPASPEKELLSSLSTVSSGLATSSSAARASPVVGSRSSSRGTTTTAATGIASSSASAALGGPARLSLATASSASKHISQRGA